MLHYYNFLCKYIDIDAHEIENLVPFNYIEDFNQRELDADGIHFLGNMLNSDRKEDLKYFDLKKGICVSKISRDTNYKNFAVSLHHFCRNPLDSKSIDDRVRIYNETPEHLRTDSILIPRVGKIVKSLFDKSELITTKTPEFLGYQSREWDRIGANLFYWTCSRNQEPINI